MTMTELISAYWPTLLFYSVMAAIIIGVVGFIRGSRESVPLSGIKPNELLKSKVAESTVDGTRIEVYDDPYITKTGKSMTEGRPISKVEMFNCSMCGSISWSAIPVMQTPETDICWICDPVAWGLELLQPSSRDIPEDLQTLLDAQPKGIQAIIESDVSEKHKIALIIKKKDAARKRAVSRKNEEIAQLCNRLTAARFKPRQK